MNDQILKAKSRLKSYVFELTEANERLRKENRPYEGEVMTRNINIDSIYTDVKRFQNRQSEFSEESKKRIVKAYENGEFSFAKFDPIVVWYDADADKYFVLSGHSRLAAFKEIAKKDKLFQTIPARYFYGSEEKAIDFALNSNTLSTKESDMERAIYYHRQRMQCELTNHVQGLGAPQINCAKMVEIKCKEAEGGNSAYILQLSYLNPEGYLADSMKRIGSDKGSDDANIIRTIASWTGYIRMHYPEVSDLQENEIAKFLINGGYGNKANQFHNKKAFEQRFQYSFSRWKQRGSNPLESLNLANSLSKTPFEKDYEARLAKAEEEMTKAQKEHDEKETKYRAMYYPEGKITWEKYTELMKPYIDYLAKCKAEVARIKGQKEQVKQAGGAQQTLWGTASDKVSVRFNKEIMRYKAGELSETYKIYVCRTPKFWKEIGFKDSKVYIAKKVIDKAMEKHSLTPEHFINFPDTLRKDSPMFLSKKEGYVQITELVDIKGHAIVIAIHLKNNNGNLELYKIASVHGRVQRQIEKWENSGLRIH